MTPPAASSGRLLGFMFSLLLVSAAAAQPDLRVKPGQNITLRCRGLPRGAFSLLTWTRADLRPDDYVLFHRDGHLYRQYQHPSFRGRVKLRDASAAEDGDYSIILQNVSSGDAGTYQCRVVMKGRGGAPAEVKHFINLSISVDEEPEEEPEEEEPEEEEPEEEPEEEEPEEGGGKVGVVIWRKETSAVVWASLVLLFIISVGLAVLLCKRRRSRLLASCRRCFSPAPPAESPAVKQPLQPI